MLLQAGARPPENGLAAANYSHTNTQGKTHLLPSLFPFSLALTIVTINERKFY